MQKTHGALIHYCIQNINVLVTLEHHDPIFTKTSSGHVARKTLYKQGKINSTKMSNKNIFPKFIHLIR